MLPAGSRLCSGPGPRGTDVVSGFVVGHEQTRAVPTSPTAPATPTAVPRITPPPTREPGNAPRGRMNGCARNPSARRFMPQPTPRAQARAEAARRCQAGDPLRNSESPNHAKTAGTKQVTLLAANDQIRFCEPLDIQVRLYRIPINRASVEADAAQPSQPGIIQSHGRWKNWGQETTPHAANLFARLFAHHGGPNSPRLADPFLKGTAEGNAITSPSRRKPRPPGSALLHRRLER